MMNRFNQNGVTLIELMISMLIGLFIIGGVLTVYIAVSKSSAATLKQSRLNGELSALMNIMVNDIRRAGYWELNTDKSLDGAEMDTFTEAELNAYAPQDNPFNQLGSTVLDIRNQITSGSASVGVTGNGPCILYTYDADRDGTVDSGEGFGFRWNGDGIDMRKTGSTTTDCSTSGEWEGIIDTNIITVTNLVFDLANSQCINATDDSNPDCYSSGTTSGDATAEIRVVIITLAAELTGDDLVKITMQQTVRVRNDLIRVR